VSDVTRIVWWNVPPWLEILLYLGTAAGLAVSALHLARHARAVIRGRPIRPAPGFHLGPAVRRVLADVLSHRRLLEDPGAGWAHALLFYGFLGLFIGTCLVFVHDRGFPFLVGPTYLVFSFLLEWAGLAFLTGVGWMLWRRAGSPVPRLERSGVALVILGLLGAIGVTGFLLEAARLAATDPPFEAWSFVGWTLSRALRAGGVAGVTLHRALWGVHAALCWLFFGLIGATVLRHMVAAPVQLALRQLRAPGRLAPSVADPGPIEPRRLTWAQLLDAATCVRCGRCTAVCPATAAGKPLDPRRVVQATLRAMRENRPLETLVEPEEAWSCTTCAACVRACPFEIEVLDKLVDLRRALVERGVVDPAATRALEATMERGNPFGGLPADRVTWAADLGVRVLRPGEATDVLYWVGCAGAFDAHGRQTARATARLLRAAGVEFAILGSAETCTGDPARRIGDETAFREAASRVAETLAGVRFRRLVTHCAHCFNVFRNELAPETDGTAIPAAHHTQLLAELVRSGRLAPRAATGESVTLHDPCYLARHNGETAAPRTVLATGSGGPIEMPRSGERTFCCGAGGGGAWVEVRQGSRIAALRMAEARETGARVVATACPFCALMLAGETQPGDIAVRDVAELLWESQPAAAAGSAGTRPERP
jgi:Fe-S oxidoreductase/nitrate reductase gamma subunit